MFHKYYHLERLGNSEVENVHVGTVFIQPKLDGTNSSIWFEKGELQTASRNRHLSLEKDNAGFCAYVQENKGKFLPLFTLLPNVILYGEFLVKNVIKTYRSDAWRKFYVFDVALIRDSELEYLTPEQYQPVLESLNIDYVPVISKVENFTGDWAQFLSLATFLLDPTIENNKAEGIVIKNYNFVNKYGRKTFAKLINTEVMLNAKKTNSKVHEQGGLELEIAQKYVTSHMIDKERAKIENATGNGSIQGRLLQTIFYTLIQEELWDILKKYKNPTIDFKKLNREVIEIVKSHCKDLF